MNLAYKKILGKFTKVLGFGKTPPHVGKNSQIISFFFLRAYLKVKDVKKMKIFFPNGFNATVGGCCQLWDRTKPQLPREELLQTSCLYVTQRGGGHMKQLQPQFHVSGCCLINFPYKINMLFSNDIFHCAISNCRFFVMI